MSETPDPPEQQHIFEPDDTQPIVQDDWSDDVEPDEPDRDTR